jgi:hypothetical protein
LAALGEEVMFETDSEAVPTYLDEPMADIPSSIPGAEAPQASQPQAAQQLDEFGFPVKLAS